jgi:hypothetical protein
MLKPLAIPAFLLAVLYTVNPAPGRATANAGNGGGNDKNSSHGNQNAASPTLPLVNPQIQPVAADPHGNGVASENTNRSVTLTGLPPVTLIDRKKTFWDYFYEWGQWVFAGVLAIVGYQQVRLLKRQEDILREARDEIRAQAGHMEAQVGLMERQTKVSEQTSQNATDSLNLFVNAERARITIDIADSGRSFRIQGKNTGKAVAKITLARGYTAVLPHGQRLPETPPYLSEPETFGDFIESVSPNDSITPIDLDRDGYDFLVDLSDLDLCAAIRDKQKVLWAYGRILYLDGISSLRRETRFCYEATVDERMNTGILMSGPMAYRIET